ncbi:MAG TPA: hypothetical protein VEC36_12585 [Patescibacteria group bacterium]|nr:hypothetical protein [Patescibacteria group bacterium]
MNAQEEQFLYRSLTILAITPIIVVICIPLILYIIFLPLIAIGSIWGEGNYKQNFLFYSKWFLGLFFKNPSPSGRI